MMKKKINLHWLIGFMSSCVYASIGYDRFTMPGAQYYDGKKLNIPLTNEEGLKLYEHWIHQGVSGIMSAIADQKLKKLNEFHRNKLFSCTKRAENIIEQAGCIIRALEVKPKSKSSKASQVDVLKWLLERGNERVKEKPVSMVVTTDLVHRILFRARREVVNRHEYKLRTKYETKTPLGLLAKLLSQTTKAVKGESRTTSLSAILSRIEAIQRKQNEKNRMIEAAKRRFKNAKSFIPGMKKPVLRTLEDKLKSDETKKLSAITGLVRNTVKLAMLIGGDNSTDVNKKSLRFASPRFFSLVPDEDRKEINVLSPSLFSLHYKGKGIERETSIPHLLKTMANDDYVDWLDFIADASGVTNAIERIEKYDKENSTIPETWSSMPRGIDGQPLYFTKENITDPDQLRNIEISEEITKSLTPMQLEDFNTTGYSLLTPEQLQRMYGPGSPYSNENILNHFLKIRKEDLDHHIIQSIRYISKMKPEKLKRRVKRQLGTAVILSPIVLSPFIFDPVAVSAPIILSPVVLSPLVFSPAILGPVILSPWLFIPIILSPRLLCPAIVSPAALSVFVLSPLALDPFILSPVVLAPTILSPKVLCPLILSPSVLSPLVLTPFCLSPFVMSPYAATALVLSPFVLSPFLSSPGALALTLFSPNMLSPAINSSSVAVTSLFSPTIMS